MYLEPGEEKKVTLVLEKKDMGFYNNQEEYVMEDGKFNLFIGTDSENCMSQQIMVKF